MSKSFSRLAIVNRGEPAMRVIHAVRELNEQHASDTRLIALFTEPERDAMFVRHADEAICIGPSTTVDGGGSRRSGYLDLTALERALKDARADAAWVGWGFVAEQPEFAELCVRLGIVFVGPDPEVMRLVGDKISAKRLAEEAGVPVAAWSGGPVGSVTEAVVHARRIGFPVMIKAAAGGGGRGIRRVEHEEDLARAFASARSEALQAFGDDTLLLERLMTHARHVEVQIVADGQGGVWPLGVRDCSYQRRNQKVIEESSSPALSAEQERELMGAAAQLARRAGYRGAGTVEFLYDPGEQQFAFMEVNARLQVEHPVTEMVTGTDLVKLQLHVAGGGTLEGDPPSPTGHAIEARLNAEDPALGFAPAPGRLAMLRLPTGPGLRVDTGVCEGDLIPADFDSMIGKVIAWGHDRDEALARLRRGLADTVVVVDGGTTNQGFLLELLDRDEVRAGQVDTSLLDRLFLAGGATPDRHGDLALLQAAVELADEDLAADRARFYAFARRGRPQSGAELTRFYELSHRGHAYSLQVSQIASDRYRIRVDGLELELRTRRLGEHERRIELRGESHRTLTSRQGDDLLIEIDGLPHRISRADRGIVRILSPAVVVSIPVSVGDIVEEGDVVAVVEAMKMESSLTAPTRGRVRDVFAGENVHVAAQAPLLALDPLDEPGRKGPEGRISFAPAPHEPSGAIASEHCTENLRRMGWLILGYDIDGAETERMIADLHGSCADARGCEPELLRGENALLLMFADLQSVSRPQLHGDPSDADLLRSPQEHFHAWLRSLDASAEGLPERFVAQLRQALGHYGIDTLDRTPALEEACHRLFVSQQRSETARRAVLAILDRRLEDAEQLEVLVDDEFREALDRLVAVLEGRDPVVADLAREVRFRYFDQPVIEAARDRAYAEIAMQIAALGRGLPPREREHAIATIVHCPRPLASLLTSSLNAAGAEARAALLEAMVRRYYRTRSIEALTGIELDARQFVLGSYRVDGRMRRVLACHLDLRDVAAAVAAFANWAAALPEGELAALDLYASGTGASGGDADSLAETFGLALADVQVPRSVHRVVIAVAQPQRGRGMGAIDTFTFRPDPETAALVEDRLSRGLHPMMGERLQLWRYREFDLERIPSAEDIYAFRGVARGNPRDERLFALAEVRDLTPVIDEEGRRVALPELEQVLVQVLETIRRFQARRPLHDRLMWNRVVLHVWPLIHLGVDELRTMVARLAPSTAGLGLEMLCIQGRVAEPDGPRERLLRFFASGHEVALEVDDPPRRALHPLDEGALRIIAARRRGLLHPAEVVRLLAPSHATQEQPAGKFVEHDLDVTGRLVPVQRPAATNETGIVVGLVRNFTDRYPEGMQRVILLGDPTRSLGSLAEPECRRIIAAIDLAEETKVPVEWFALSAGAKIAMDSGTETMDWIAAVLRRIVQFTQAGGEINVVVSGINVGAQPYWNAEATMLMHTRGALIMTPASAMVLTGKLALDYSGGISAEDNLGIGGYERIMGPNGEAQYWAPDLGAACHLLLSYYEHTYVAPGERFPRRAASADPIDRAIRDERLLASAHGLTRVGDVFSDTANPDRKLPFDVRSVMRAVVDRDHAPLERWGAMRAAEIAVVWDAHLGGWPVSLIGIESKPLPRHGSIPADGPEMWTSGTLFPRSAKKVARAINASGGRRPVVVLANLVGFDGSPESMREWQLEFGAEIGRAVVNCEGPIVFCVISRYHGGAFVVFSQRLNPNLEAIAVAGARASVIGGAPAAAVVFSREVEHAAAADSRIAALDERIAGAEGAERQRLRSERAALWNEVLAQCRRDFADRFDSVHSIARAVSVGSVSSIVAPSELRSSLVDAVQRGIHRFAPSRSTEVNSDGRVAQPTLR